jgi:hypothetical protein
MVQPLYPQYPLNRRLGGPLLSSVDFLGSQSSSVVMATKLQAETTKEPGFDSQQEQEMFPFSITSRRALGAHPASYTMGYGACFPGGRGVKTTTHLHLVLRSRVVKLYFYSTMHHFI